MHKAMMEKNVQLHHVVSDITGVTGMRIIRAIVAGERTPMTVAEMRDVRCHVSVETICAALSGNWRDEHIFALCQSLALYDFYGTVINFVCGWAVEHYAAMALMKRSPKMTAYWALT
jgi:transposase